VTRAPELVVATVAAVAVAAGLALAHASGGATATDARRDAFHAAVGGLGTGPSVDLSCPSSFDVRLEGRPALGPVPSAPGRYPLRACSLLPSP
jgi:hypothetical protein